NAGFVSNDNLFWNSTSQPPVRYRGTRYSTVSAYSSATGNDSRTIQSNPRFAGASSGDFHLLAGSPAIARANSSIWGWSSKDCEGKSRYDDPNPANHGLGSVTYADRGCCEFVGGTATAGEAVALDAAAEPPPPDDPPPGDAAP